MRDRQSCPRRLAAAPSTAVIGRIILRERAAPHYWIIPRTGPSGHCRIVIDLAETLFVEGGEILGCVDIRYIRRSHKPKGAALYVILRSEATKNLGRTLQIPRSARNAMKSQHNLVKSDQRQDCARPFDQGSITSIPQPSKSLTSLVATDALRERAVAAIWQSAWLMGCPAARRPAAIRA